MSAFDFTHAIVRKPARSVVDGIRKGEAAPGYEAVAAEHAAYAAALLNAGLAVTLLAAAEEFSDSVFVEDPALVFPEGAVLLRPGAPSRAGESALLEPVLKEKFATVLTIDSGHVDGGDVLASEERVLIGLSARTDEAGAKALMRALAEFGKRAAIVETPKGVLHFKSDCALIGEDVILTTKRLSASGVFKGFDEIIVPDGEEPAANALRVNKALFIGARHRRTIDLLAARGYSVVALPTDEIAKLDAGLSCMSLRWRAAA